MSPFCPHGNTMNCPLSLRVCTKSHPKAATRQCQPCRHRRNRPRSEHPPVPQTQNTNTSPSPSFSPPTTRSKADRSRYPSSRPRHNPLVRSCRPSAQTSHQTPTRSRFGCCTNPHSKAGISQVILPIPIKISNRRHITRRPKLHPKEATRSTNSADTRCLATA